MIDIAEMLSNNPDARIVLFKDYFSKSKGAMFVTADTYNLNTIDNFIGQTHRGYGVVEPVVEDYSEYEVSIEDGKFILHTIKDKLLKECKEKGRYLILNHYTNTHVDINIESFRAIEATFKYGYYELKSIMEGNPSDIEVIKLATDVVYEIDLVDTYPDDPGCGMYTMVVDYSTPSI